MRIIVADFQKGQLAASTRKGDETSGDIRGLSVIWLASVRLSIFGNMQTKRSTSEFSVESARVNEIGAGGGDYLKSIGGDPPRRVLKA